MAPILDATVRIRSQEIQRQTTHGSPFSPNSINNSFGLSGSPYSFQSPTNPYTVTAHIQGLRQRNRNAEGRAEAVAAHAAGHHAHGVLQRNPGCGLHHDRQHVRPDDRSGGAGGGPGADASQGGGHSDGTASWKASN